MKPTAESTRALSAGACERQHARAGARSLGTGGARVVAEEHWASDLVGGWLAGAAVALGAAGAYGRDRRGRELPHAERSSSPTA